MPPLGALETTDMKLKLVHLRQIIREELDQTALRPAYGGVVFDSQGRILLREPSGHYDGYVWTFPKGRPDAGETPEEAALREVQEETGIIAKIVKRLPGDFIGGTTVNRFFVMSVVSDTGKHDFETSRIRWATPDEAARLIGKTTNLVGKKRDLAILAAATSF